MTWPNFITLGRLLSVPLIIWLVLVGDYPKAFWAMVIAGASDILDGLLARTLKVYSLIGAYLDPLADKALLIGVSIALSIKSFIPLWLVILIVFRDILILGGVILLWGIKKNFQVKPLMVSKVNTLFQITTVVLVMAQEAYHIFEPYIFSFCFFITALTTVMSAGGYIRILIRTLKEEA
jgi:cardiolipin synthase